MTDWIQNNDPRGTHWTKDGESVSLLSMGGLFTVLKWNRAKALKFRATDLTRHEATLIIKGLLAD